MHAPCSWCDGTSGGARQYGSICVENGTEALAQIRSEDREAGWWLLFPLDAVALPVRVRSWRSGDRMHPHGVNGTKKLQDIFTDRKVARKERHRVPILVDADGAGRILAVDGLHVDAQGVCWRTGAPLPRVSDILDKPTLVLRFRA